MRFTRRNLIAMLFAPKCLVGATFEVDRLLAAGTPGARPELRKYTANATVMLFSIPIFSRAGVGSGYAQVEESGPMLSIQFGAGSYPETARGLNRLGFIQEVVVEDHPGVPSECAWLAFMTTSQEKDLEQAKKALEASGAVAAYSASQGVGQQGSFRSRVDRLEFPSKYTWRDIVPLVAKARAGMTELRSDEGVAAQSSAKTATFLYLVRRAILDRRPQSRSTLIFNSKEFQLDTRKEADGATMRMNAMLTEKHTGNKTPFRLWYAPGSGLPVKFEYQAKSFLRLTFEADPKALAPQIRFEQTSKENA